MDVKLTATPDEDSPSGPSELLFRRQFLLDEQDVDGFPGWHRQTVAGRYRLLAHPDLELTHVEADGRSMTLLGYALDPGRPDAGNGEIVSAVVRRLTGDVDAAGLTSRLGGRWVAIVHDGRRTTLFHDAGGLRQAFFATRDASGHRRLVCASQPTLVAERLGLEPDPQALDFIAARGDDDFGEYHLPGDRSPYAEVRALLPNHRLDLGEGRAERYWPAGPLPPRTYGEALQESVLTLRGLFDAARRRYPLTLSMTAGWDSRLMLALSHGSAREIFYFTITYPHHGERSRDVAVPAELLARLGLVHHLIPYPKHADPVFRAVVKRNTASLEKPYCADVEALHERLPSGRVCVTGDVAEVVKGHYRLPGRAAADVTVADLAPLCAGGAHPFARAALEEWLSGAGSGEAVAVGDLFCWEYMAGRWQARIRAQYDIVQESFAPLSCRDLLATMLAVDERERSAPGHRLFRDIIAELWPDVLAVPINPPERTSWRRRLEKALDRSGLRRLVPRGLRQAIKRARKVLR